MIDTPPRENETANGTLGEREAGDQAEDRGLPPSACGLKLTHYPTLDAIKEDLAFAHDGQSCPLA